MRPLVRSVLRPALPSVLSFALALSFALSTGCDDKKAPGGGTASSASASDKGASAPTQPSSATAAASAAADPKLHKELTDRVVAYLTAVQKAYGGAKPDELKAFLGFFPKADAAQKEGKSLYETAAFAGKEGMSISSFDVTDLDLDDKLTKATAAVAEKQMQRGKPRCAIYQLSWELQASSWVRVGRKDIADNDCTN